MANSEKTCPLMKSPLGKPQQCIRDECMWYVRINGTNKNNGEQLINEGGCAIAWTPMLLIENAQMTRELGAATEGLRNRSKDTNESVEKLVTAQKETLKTLQSVTGSFANAVVQMTQPSVDIAPSGAPAAIDNKGNT